jgi:hypothetical protein
MDPMAINSSINPQLAVTTATGPHVDPGVDTAAGERRGYRWSPP